MSKQSTENAQRQFDSTMLLTWPDLSIEVRLFPWQWRLIPRGWYDYSPRAGDHSGWWGIDGEWLFLKARFGFNLPPFESPWLTTPPARIDEQADAEERAVVAATTPADHPHYELNDGTCVSCGQEWICDAAALIGLRNPPAVCECPPCPGRGNDGHGMSHCAECCFGSGVEADIDCPIHGASESSSTPGVTTGGDA